MQLIVTSVTVNNAVNLARNLAHANRHRSQRKVIELARE